MSEIPIRPERPPMSPPDEKRRGNNWITLLLALVMALGGLVSLLVMPLVGSTPIIALAVVGFIALHYFTWGWWLAKKLRENSPEDEET